MLLNVILSIHIIISTNSRLEEIFAWKQLDFQFPNDESRKQAIETEQFIPGNSVITGIEIYKGRLFICIPRIKPGVPSTLNYIITSKGNGSFYLVKYRVICGC